MAKKITRTFTVTECDCVCVSNGETTALKFILDGEINDPVKALKLLRKQEETDELKIGAVIELTPVSTLREMDSKFFYEHSNPVEQ